MLAHRFRIEPAQFLDIAHRLLLTRHLDVYQTRPWKIFHPRCVRGDGSGRLHLCRNLRRFPPAVKLDRYAGMIGPPFANESLSRRVTAMAGPDPGSPEPM